MKKNCKRCGKEFEAKHPSRKYCPGSCKQYAYYERKGMTFGKTVNPVSTTEDIKSEEDEHLVVQNVVSIEIPAMEQVNPVTDTTVIDETPSITPVMQEKIPVVPKKVEKPEIKTTVQEKPTVNITLEQLEMFIKKASAPQPQEKVIVIEKQIPVQTAVKEEVKPTPQTKAEPQKERSKSFLDKLSERVNDRNGVNGFTKDHYPGWHYTQWENVKYVNERVKSHFKKLTEFTKRPVDISVIRYITKQMNDLIGSFYFRYLPADYPFTDFIEELSERMIEYIEYLEKEEIEKVRIKISEEKYIEMKAIIAEIGTTAPDVDHSTPTSDSNSTGRYNRYEHRARMRELGIISKSS